MNQDANRYVADALSAVVLAAGRVETPQERAVLRITAGSLVQLVFEPPLVAEATKPVTAEAAGQPAAAAPGPGGQPDYVPPGPITAPPAPGGQQTLPGAAPAPPAPFNAAAAFAPPAAAAPVAAVPAQVAADAAPVPPPVAAAAPAAPVVLSPFAGM